MNDKVLTLEQVEKVLRKCRRHPSPTGSAEGSALPVHRFSDQTVREIMDDMELEAR